MDLGFTISTVDPSVFFYTQQSISLFVLVYVDDFLITSSDLSCISDLVIALRSEFPITDLGSLKFFLGIEATFDSIGLLLTQQQYIKYLLHKTNMHLAKSVKSPMAATEKLSASFSLLFDDPTFY